MASSKDEIKPATAQARLSEDEAVRVRYKHGTPLEGGKIAESEPIHLFPTANPEKAAAAAADPSPPKDRPNAPHPTTNP